MVQPARESKVDICEPNHFCHVLITQILKNSTIDATTSEIVVVNTTIQRGCKLATDDDDEDHTDNSTSIITFACSSDYCNVIPAENLMNLNSGEYHFDF